MSDFEQPREPIYAKRNVGLRNIVRLARALDTPPGKLLRGIEQATLDSKLGTKAGWIADPMLPVEINSERGTH